MIITSKVNMDLMQRSWTASINAVQDDRYSRDLEISLYTGDVPWNIPENAQALICYSKADGTGGEYDTLPDGTTAWSAEGNVLTIALTPQVLTVPGPVSLSVKMIQEEKQLSTFSVLINVHPAVNKEIAESDDYYHVTAYLPAPATAKTGQYFRIAAVDERGKVTALEAVNLEEGGSDRNADLEEIQRLVEEYLEENPPAPGERGPAGADGKDGSDGITPHIGNNGNWFIGSTDTGKPSRGADGVDGRNGSDGYTPVKGVDYFDGTDGAAGAVGPVGPQGPAGSDANVTAENIQRALGYIPADMEVVNQLSSEIGITAIPSFWQQDVDSVIATIKSLQQGKNCVTFVHFSDNHTRRGYSGMLIAEVMKKCHIPYCFYNGDSVSSGYIASEAIMVSQAEAFEKMISVIPDTKFCRSLGNHDGYWAVSASEKYTYSREQNYELFLRKWAAAQNKQFGDDGTYYYVEDLASKVRFVVLNSNGGSFDNAQVAWLQNTALKFDETGWAVVFFSHQPVTNNFHSNISNAQTVQGIITDLIEAETADVIGWFSGHIHRDRIYQCDATGNTDADDTVTVALPWKTVTITSDDTSIAYEDATKHTIAEDVLSHAIDFVTVNRDTKTVNLTRLGIGNNRVYSYDHVFLHSITNVLTNVSTSNSGNSVESGDSYTATLTENAGYENLIVSVTMGGLDITSTAYSGGVVTIGAVTGDVVITAQARKAEEEPAYTNLADPSAEGWVSNSRLSSSGTDKGEGGYPGGVVSNWIEVSKGDVIRVKGIDIRDSTAGYVVLENNDGSIECPKCASYDGFAQEGDDIWSFTVWKLSTNGALYGDEARRVRISGRMTAAQETEIVITANQEIV